MEISKIRPETKDYQRAKDMAFYKSGMRNWFYGNGAPIQSLAEKQAKLIKGREKLVRRAKAVAAVWGTRDHYGYSQGNPIKENPWEPFREALVRMGFLSSEIREIAEHRVTDEFLRSI